MEASWKELSEVTRKQDEKQFKEWDKGPTTYETEENIFSFFFVKILSVPYVRLQLNFGQTWVNFVRLMSDNLLLFAALHKYVKMKKMHIQGMQGMPKSLSFPH